MVTISETNVDNGSDLHDVEINSGNGVRNEEGKEDLDGYKNISEMTEDDIRGMEFESEKEACDFYEMYARCHGFVARKDDVERDFKGNVVARQLVCTREGKRHKKYMSRVDQRRGPRPMTRTDCRARFRVAYVFMTGKWRALAIIGLIPTAVLPV